MTYFEWKENYRLERIKRNEVWKDIPNYEGIYQVSNLGRVKSIIFTKERILKPQKGTTGYYAVSLWKNKKPVIKQIHLLVAVSFINYIPVDTYKVVDHKDNNKLNNVYTNLQIITRRENASKDQFRLKRSSDYIGVCWDKHNNKWKSQIRIDSKSKHLGSFMNEIDAHNAYQNKLKELNK